MDKEISYESIKEQAKAVITEFLAVAKVPESGVLVIGCSSSEVKGVNIGKGSDIDAAKAIYNGIMPVLKEKNIHLAAQCCEHLNRAIVMERAAIKPWENEIVNVVPQLHAGGSFAKTCYCEFTDPVVVEYVKADAGIDIGDTLIGMHLKPVAVPVRIKTKQIGEAHVVCARTRAKFIGGERAVYDPALTGHEVER